MTEKQAWILVLGISILAAVLRMVGLENQSLWLDELFSWYAAAQPSFADAMIHGSLNDVHPPLYPIVLWSWVQLFGDDPWSLRFPSVIFGVINTLLLYLVGRRLFNPQIGVITALLCAVAWVSVYHSQEARHYSQLMCLTSLHLLACVSLTVAWNHSQRQVIYYLLYVGSALLLLYTHVISVIPVGIGVIVVLGYRVFNRQALGWTIASVVAIGIGFLPWMLFLLSLPDHSVWMTPPTLSELLRGAQLIFGKYSISFILSVSVLGLGIIAVWMLTRRNPIYRSSAVAAGVLLIALVVSFLLITVISYTMVPLYSERTILFVVPIALLLLGVMIHFVQQWFKLRGFLALGLALTMLIELTILRSYYSKPYNAQFREAAQILESWSAIESLPTYALVGHNSYLQYYLQRSPLPDPELRPLPKKEKDLESGLPQDFYLVRCHYNLEPWLTSFLSKNYEVVDRKQFIKAEVIKYRSLKSVTLSDPEVL